MHMLLSGGKSSTQGSACHTMATDIMIRANVGAYRDESRVRGLYFRAGEGL